MISEALLNRFILKYASDVNDSTKEYREKVNNEPELYSKMREDDNKRNKAYHERQRTNPSEAFISRQRSKSQSLKELKESGSLDGIAKLMSTAIATYKSTLKQALIKKYSDPDKVNEHPIFQQWLKDSSEFYYLCNKIKELSGSDNNVNKLIEVKNLCDSYLEKFNNGTGKYKSIIKHILSTSDKLDIIAKELLG